MKLNDVLREGLIKLPQNLRGEIVKFFVRMYLAHYQDWIEEELVGKEYYEAKKLADDVANEYDVSVGEDDIKRLSTWVKEKFVLTADDVPYADKLKKIYPNFVEELGLPIKVTIVLDYGHQPVANELADFDPNDNTIRIAMPNVHLAHPTTEHGRKEALMKNLTWAVGLIDHELTHAVQHIVLSRFHKAQVSNAFDAAGTSKFHSDDYFNSQIEFDPWIKGEAAIFKAIEKLMKKIGKEYDEKLSMEFFVGAKGDKKTDFMDQKEMTKVMFTAPSAFFLSLKKKNQDKWKKAVKLFTEMVM